MSLVLNWLESLHVDMKVSEACSRMKNLNSTCSYCLDQCKQKAISFKEKMIEIDSDRCSFCGECIVVCPLSAIEGLGTSRDFENGSLLFDDSYTPLMKELLIYHKQGLQSIQVGGTLLNEDWENAVDEVNSLLSILKEQPIKVTIQEKEEKLSRREFFTSFQKEGRQLAKSMAPAKWKINKGGWNLSHYYPDFQFFKVEVDKGKCSLCQACFSFCSQKVFLITESSLQIENDKCVNCTACTDICPENAIRISPEIQEKSITILDFQQNKCNKCGQTFYTFQTGAENCHYCLNRDPEWLSPY